MKINRRFTKSGQDVFSAIEFDRRTSRITNPDGSVVFEMKDAAIPKSWSQLATDIMVSKYFRKAGIPVVDEAGKPKLDEAGKPITTSEKSAAQVIHRLAGCWRQWGEEHGYFDTAEDAQAFYDELSYMLLKQMCAPNSPQWFNTGLNYAYGITGPSQGHFYCDPATGELQKSKDAYSRPQPHACFIQSVADDLVNPGGIMDLWVREARLFKYGSGTGSNFSKIRGENESLSGGGKSSGLMSFLKIGDRAAGAIKSGGTTRRAAKMVCLDLDHPDVEDFINWKVREELKVAALAEGIKVLPKDQQEQAKKLGLKLDYDFNGEAYITVSGQNSNNSVRIPNAFFSALEHDGQWVLKNRTNKKTKTLKAADLWDTIAFAAWRCADPGVQYDDTINQWHTCPDGGRINASNPCVTGDTRVLTPGGIWRRIDQMIHLPSRVVTNLGSQTINVTEGSFPTGVKPVYELRTVSGYSVKLTADHKVWTRSRGWVEAQDLTSADELRLPASPACQTAIGEPRDGKFFDLLGLYLSDAGYDAAALNLDSALGDEDLAFEYTNYVSDTWGDWHDDGLPAAAETDLSDVVDGSTLMTARLSTPRLLARMKAYIRGTRGARQLTDDAFTAGLAAQRHVLRGLFSADAGITSDAIVLHSSSAELLADVQTLLLGFGVKSAVATRAGRGTLRIEGSSLAAFGKHVGLLGAARIAALAELIGRVEATLPVEHHDAFESLTPIGKQQVFDLTEPVTSSFVAAGITVHNCSEYMFLDDTACNLASLNVMTFFDADSRSFDIEGYKHGVRLWTIVLEISVLMASFPSEAIAELSYKYRTLGLGYANLGAMLMQAGIPYDSDKGRAICAALTSILTGESYATSAEMAAELGAFAGFADNREHMLRVIRNHRRAAYDVTHNAAARRSIGDYEGLDIKPVGIDLSQFNGSDSLCSPRLLASAQDCWDRALAIGEQFGYRNAQSTVIAPTGTIGLLMDCDTTGVEPDFALVKFKKLAGGGYFKIANQSLRPALVNLGYTASQVHDILQYVMGTLTFNNAPYVNTSALLEAGLTHDEIAAIEATLPGMFELGFAFSPWSLSEETFKRLGIEKSEWQAPSFSLLRRLGFKKKQIDAANDVIVGRGTIEGAPHLREEHYPVFDCANKCGKHGKRFIAVDGHIKMMAAAQPFISGAISKTINLPNEATIADIKESYLQSWKLGLKANALYRDGSKLSQPLNVKSDADESEEDDADNVASAREEVARDVAAAANVIGRSDNLSPAPMHTHVIEKIVERIVERPLRRRLPDTRHAMTHKFDVAGHEGYITVGLYEDGTPGEIFIRMAKEGSTIGGLMDTIATLVSVSLQYGVPVDSLVRKFEHVRFEPSGMTRNSEIPFAKSLVDYIFRWMAMEFVSGYRAVNAPSKGEEPASAAAEAISAATDAAAAAVVPSGNGHGPRTDSDSAKSFAYTDGPGRSGSAAASKVKAATAAASAATLAGRLAGIVDPLSQQGTSMQADAPACDVCGSITVRSGTCYKCQNCGNSMGCS